MNFPCDTNDRGNQDRDDAGPHRQDLRKNEPIAQCDQTSTNQKREPNAGEVGRVAEQRKNNDDEMSKHAV